MDYYLLTAEGKQAGPYSLDQIRAIWESGRITLETPYWTNGMTQWFPLRHLEPSLRPRQLALPSPAMAVPSAISTIDLRGLSPYYQREFQKIHDSGETYSGQWNWAAFFFSGLWALTKGIYLSPIISIIIGLLGGSLTCGVLSFVVGIVYMFVYGIRGNYLYYCAYVKRRQVAF